MNFDELVDLKLEWSDRWLLLAILMEYSYEQKPVNLNDIISTCDFIDHAIIRDYELHEGLAILRAKGYIEEAGGLEFIPTDKIWLPYSSYKGSRNRNRLVDLVEKLTKEMKEGSADQSDKTLRDKIEYSGLTNDIIQSTYKSYLDRVN